MRSYKIHLLRHGLTEGNQLGQYIGQRSDFPLCKEGRRELRRLLAHYEYPDIEKLYSSPLRRCLETGEILYEGFTPCPVEGLSEFDFGEFEGYAVENLPDPEKFSRFLSGQASEDIDAEDPKEFSHRVISAFDAVVQDIMRNEIPSAAVITHGGVIMTILAAMGVPRRPVTDWIINSGMGYTVLVTPSVWMREHVFEVYDIIPRISRDSDDYERYYHPGEQDAGWDDGGEEDRP